MTWEALAAIGELVAAVAVVASLIYLSKQLRAANKQSEIAALRHIADSMNKVSDLLGRDLETAEIVNRGRKDVAALNDDELLIFATIHIRLLNTMESWYSQVDQTSATDQYRAYHLKNIGQVATAWLGYPGTRALWHEFREYYEPIQDVIDEAFTSSPNAGDLETDPRWNHSVVTSD